MNQESRPKITGKSGEFITVGLNEEERKAHEEMQKVAKRNPGRPPKNDSNWNTVGRSAEQEGGNTP